MLLVIPRALAREQVQSARALLGDAPFVDGRESAGNRARRVKHNRELDPASPVAEQLNRLVIGTLYENPMFRSAVLPHRVSGGFYARYGEGMEYGEHVDDPVMGEGARYRSDVSFTVFLSGPDEYDGGELVVKASFGTQTLKLPAGDAVVYPSSSLHRVAPVDRGERLVAVGWAQSLVRDPGRRELLYELDMARHALMNATPDAQVTAHVDNVYANLVRMWAET